MASAYHLGLGRGHAPQSSQRRFGAALLDHPQESIEHDDGHDGAGFHIVAQDGRQHRGHDQDDDDEVVELLEELVPEGRARRLGQLVRAVPLETAGGLLRRQAELRGSTELHKDVAGLAGMPGVGLHGGGLHCVAVQQLLLRHLKRDWGAFRPASRIIACGSAPPTVTQPTGDWHPADSGLFFALNAAIQGPSPGEQNSLPDGREC